MGRNGYDGKNGLGQMKIGFGAMYPAYSHYDILVTHAVYFFGYNPICRNCMDLGKKIDYEQCPNSIGSCDYCGNNSISNFMEMYEYISSKILLILQQGKKEEAEKLIKKHCIFNK